MTVQGEQIKKHAVERLDHEAAIHVSGHQSVHARRYVMPKMGTPGVEIVIVVKGNDLQLWCEADALDRTGALGLGGEFRHGSETYAVPSPTGAMRYGRHTGLKTMAHLHRGDAWRFVPRALSELDRILDAIKA
ncbi:hypothetical protein EN943_01370 [Mesorhizobium sp. M7A.F.Ca.US.006.01.1.1]|uniref:hypothetical protein n=1 Tax=Mesorhizobium sp. M7A.F.Ca.US.006.01.1.1 TaxID=2496707 RepID=UPI000FC99B6E|nr:hypothetical protein [Mesorhizobium sp. M7A.F.Ca.US.006.01.1.1]RUZ81275.1 hypothetical protein EN943_01370 [Mesorhizobium sp. M7A.F.Ca.US.006.01.1.1]